MAATAAAAASGMRLVNPARLRPGRRVAAGWASPAAAAAAASCPSRSSRSGAAARGPAPRGRAPAPAQRPARAARRCVAAAAADGPTPLPLTARDMVLAAAGAVARALEAGANRQRIELLLPVNQRRDNFTYTEQLDYPDSEAEVYRTAGQCVELLIQSLPGRAGQKVTSKLVDQERDSPCGLFYPADAKDLVCVVMPTAERLKAIRELAERDPQRPILLVNPQWNDAGQVVSDFGIGPWKKAAEDFLGTFVPTYSLLERRVGAASTLDADGSAMGLGGVARLQQAHPGPWHAFAMGGDGSSELVQMSAPGAPRPTYAELLKLFTRPGLSLKAKRRTAVTQEAMLEQQLAAAGGAAAGVGTGAAAAAGAGGAGGDWALRSAAEVAAAVRSGALTPADVDVLEKSALRAALAAVDAPAAGKLADLRARLKEALVAGAAAARQ